MVALGVISEYLAPINVQGKAWVWMGFPFLLECKISTMRQEEKLGTIYFNLPHSTSSFVRSIYPWACAHAQGQMSFWLHPPASPWIFEVTHTQRKDKRNVHSIKYNSNNLFYQSKCIINQKNRCSLNYIRGTGTWQKFHLGKLSSQVYTRSIW